MRAYVVSYAGMTERPSRTISGEVTVTATNVGTATRKTVWAIAERDRVKPARILTLSLRIARGGTIRQRGKWPETSGVVGEGTSK